jgi:hypothetical protein
MISISVTLLMAFLAGPAEQKPDLTKLSWLSGSWVMEKGATRVEEHWTPVRAGTLMGVGRTMRGEKTVFYEFLRIEVTPDGITYFASPRGRDPATPFRMTEMTDSKVVFENLQHDFPNRVIYQKEKDGTLSARIEGKRNGQDAHEAWSYNPAGH